MSIKNAMSVAKISINGHNDQMVTPKTAAFLKKRMTRLMRKISSAVVGEQLVGETEEEKLFEHEQLLLDAESELLLRRLGPLDDQEFNLLRGE